MGDPDPAGTEADPFDRHIDRELHDIVVPQLFVLTTGLESLRRHPDDPGTARLVVDLALTAERALADLRAIARGDRLDWGGQLSDVVRRLGEWVRRSQRLTGADLHLELGEAVGADPHLDEALEYDLRAVVSECVSNSLRHGEAHRVVVRIELVAGWLVVRVTDDGRWGTFDRRGTGLAGLGRRAEMHDGRLEVNGGDHGTVIVWAVPLSGAADESAA